MTDPFFPSEANVVDSGKWLEFWDETLRRDDKENKGCPELFDDAASPEAKAEALLRWLGFWSKGNHDDRTILIIK